MTQIRTPSRKLHNITIALGSILRRLRSGRFIFGHYTFLITSSHTLLFAPTFFFVPCCAAWLISLSVCFLDALRSSFASFFASLSAIISSNDGMAGLLSMGSPYGAMMCFTTCRLCRDVGQPGAMATTSPVRKDEFGS